MRREPLAAAGGQGSDQGRRARPEATFEPPAVSPLAVPRRRITSLLDLAVRQRLTIVVTPPGYGKTVALSQWAASHPRQRVRWLTVNPDDNDPIVLAHRLWAALEPVADPPSRSAPKAVAKRPDGGASDAAPVSVAALVADLDRMPPTVVVLDDFHVMTDAAVLDDLATLIEHAPRSLHVVVATRVDPPLRYYRLGLSDALVELRQEDLAFTSDEAHELVRRSIGWELDAEQIDRLVARTEGWAAGLQLAALSLGERSEVDDFLDAFAGDDRHVADYLTEHVLLRLPVGVRDFLLCTSILDRMSASLCDDVTGRPGGQAMLDELERRSMFISTIDSGHRWYRYHQLFRTLLRQHLHDEDPERERALLRRAAAWHFARDDPEAAVRYLAEAGAWDQVLEAASAHGREMLERGRPAAVGSWVDLVPSAVRQGDVAAMLRAAGAYAIGGDGPRAGEIIDDVDALAVGGSVSLGERAVADLVRAYALLHAGLPAAAVVAAERSIRDCDALVDGLTPDVLGLTASPADIAIAAHVIRGIGLTYEGRLSDASACFATAPKGGHAMWQVSGLAARALLDAWSGRLNRAEHFGNRALSLARQFAMDQDPMTIDAYMALASVARDRDDLDDARAFLDEAKRRTRPDRRGLVETLLATEEAWLAMAEGQPAAGLTVLAARRLPDHPAMPDAVVARRKAVEAQLLILSGELDDAERVLALAPVRTCEVAAATVRLAVERSDLGGARLATDSWPSEPEPRAGLERSVWRAIVNHLSGDEGGARAHLLDVLAEAERDRNVGLFRCHYVFGPARTLYREAPTPFLRAIVDQPATSAPARAVKELVEQLTEREYMVLLLLPTRLSNVEIADTLGVSLNTVKTHLKHIYRKLGVTERSEAIAAAERLYLW